MKNKKPLIALFVIALVGVIGGTFAYLKDSIEIKNIFSVKPFKTEVIETFSSPSNWTPGTTTPKTLVVKNTGDVDVAVRVKYTEEWKSKNGHVLSGLQETNQAAIINFANTSNWIKNGDYYYYKNKLSKNESTLSFMESVTFNPNITANTSCVTDVNVTTCISTGDGYDGAEYTLTLTAETIQYDAYTTAWTTDVTIN